MVVCLGEKKWASDRLITRCITGGKNRMQWEQVWHHSELTELSNSQNIYL